MSAVFSHGDLRLYLLQLLAEEPRHGYDLIQALADRTGGTYTPSAGTVYPRLAKLEEEGLVTKRVDGRKTVYEITEAGRAQVHDRAADLADIEANLTDSVRLIADGVRANVREAMRSLHADLASATASAKTAAPFGTPPSGPDDTRTTSRAQIARADVVLNDFRSTVRTDLRSHVARGGALSQGTIDQLRADLADVSRKLASALRS